MFLKRKIFWLGIIPCLLFAACASPTLQAGLDHMEAGSYELAVQQLTLALAEKPDDLKIAAQLNKAKEMAAEQVFQKGNELSQKHEIILALEQFENAKRYQPNTPKYSERFNEEKQKYDEVAETIQKAGRQAREKNEWENSIQVLESMRFFKSSFPNIDKEITALKNEGAEYFISLSSQDLANQKYQEAFMKIGIAYQLSPTQEINLKKGALNHLLMSDRALKEEDYPTAFQEISNGLQLEPDNPELKKFADDVVNQWGDVLYNQAVQASNDGNLGIAREKFTKLSELKPGYLDTDALLLEVQKTFSAKYYSEAEALLKSDDKTWVGTALGYYLLAKEGHSQQFTDLDNKIEQTRSLLRKEVEFRISLGFKNVSGLPGAGGIVKNQILDKIRNSKELKNVLILEREAIDDITRELGLGQGFLDESTSLPVKKLKGIQMGIRGEVLKVRVLESGLNRPRYGSSRYISGTRSVPNHDYSRAQQDVANAQQRVLQAQQELNSSRLQQQSQNYSNPSGTQAGQMQALSMLLGNSMVAAGARSNLNAAEKELSSAQRFLARTPMNLQEDVWANFQYKIFDLKLEGEVIVAFRVIDFTTGEIGEVRNISKKDVVQDTYIPGDPGKGVKADPNTLPTREEFENKLLSEATQDTFLAIKKELNKKSYHYFDKAVNAENDGSKKEAIENYIRFIYSAPDLTDNRVNKARKYIQKQIGLVLDQS